MQTIYFLLCGFRKYQITVAWETWSYGCLMRLVFPWNWGLLLWKKVRHRKEADFSFLCAVLSIPFLWCCSGSGVRGDCSLKIDIKCVERLSCTELWIVTGYILEKVYVFMATEEIIEPPKLFFFVISSTSWLPSSNSILNELLVYKKYKEILLLLILFGYLMCNEENFLWCVLSLMTWFLLTLN